MIYEAERFYISPCRLIFISWGASTSYHLSNKTKMRKYAERCELGFGDNLLVVGEAFGDMLVLCGSILVYWLCI